MNRRHFLKGAGSAGMLAALSQLSLSSAFADSSNDYKALVIVFLFGGNDSNNMIIPYDASAYATYAGVRGVLAIPQAQLAPLANPTNIDANAMNGVQQFGLHPALAPLASLWDAGEMAIQFNAGTLAKPTTQAQLKNCGLQVTGQSVFAYRPATTMANHRDCAARCREQWLGRPCGGFDCGQ